MTLKISYRDSGENRGVELGSERQFERKLLLCGGSSRRIEAFQKTSLRHISEPYNSVDGSSVNPVQRPSKKSFKLSFDSSTTCFPCALFTDAEPRTATEVADELGIVRRTALNKLNELAEEDQIHKKKVGSRAVVWWVSGDGE